MPLDTAEYGRKLSRWLEWDIEKIYQIAYSALEDANAHDLAAALKEAYEDFEERERQELHAEWWAAGQSCGIGD